MTAPRPSAPMTRERREIRRLRAALKPFANIPLLSDTSDWIVNQAGGDMIVAVDMMLQPSDVHRARAALLPGDDGERRNG